MNNKRSYIGDAVGRGLRRRVFNVILVIALALATIGSLIQIKKRVVDKLWKELSGEKTEQVHKTPPKDAPPPK